MRLECGLGALVVLLWAALDPGQGLDNELARTPPLGWITGERFYCNVDCVNYPDDCIRFALFMDVHEPLERASWASGLNSPLCHLGQGGHSGLRLRVPPFCRGGGGAFRPLTPAWPSPEKRGQPNPQSLAEPPSKDCLNDSWTSMYPHRSTDRGCAQAQTQFFAGSTEAGFAMTDTQGITPDP